MKKWIILAAALVGAAAAMGASKNVPLMIAVPQQAEYVPDVARAAMANKMRQLVDANGMSASGDAGQFFLTCVLTVQDKQVIGGAPTRIAQKIDVTFYVADALNEKVFGTATVTARGVGENETKSLISAVQQIAVANPVLKSLITDTNAKIIAYYEAECDNILLKARTYAAARQYEMALFQLSLVPEQCSCFPRVVAEAEGIYRRYADAYAETLLAKARAIWSAAQNRDAAMEAGEYLAMIPSDASCYKAAQALQQEIAARVKGDIDFDRKQLEWDQQNKHDIIKGWRDIGVAYGNNQKSVTYSPVWLVR